jgi:hypothetical protein
MSFESLSNELIIEIIQYLLHDADLLSFGKTCRLLYTLSTPYLYSSIGQQDFEWCKLFLRTISARPDLAAMVETYTGCENKWESRAQGALEYRHFPEQSWAVMGKAITEISESEEYADTWYTLLFCDPPGFDQLTAMMIALLPNLQELHMQTYGYQGNYSYIEQVLDHATNLQKDTSFSSDAPSPHSLSQLRFTSIRYWNSANETSVRYAIPYCRLPSVRKFIGRYFSNGGTTPPFNSQVEELAFFDSYFHPSTFIYVLGNFPHLRKFTYDDDTAGVDEEVFSPAALRKGLEACRENLEKLYITARDLKYLSEDVDNATANPTSFANFPKLRRIDVSAFILIEPRKDKVYTNDEGDEGDEGVVDTNAFLQRIPRSLKALKLTNCSSRLGWPCVRELVRRKEEVAPDLKFVRLEFGYRKPEPKRIGPAWIEECRMAGVKLFLPFDF